MKKLIVTLALLAALPATASFADHYDDAYSDRERGDIEYQRRDLERERLDLERDKIAAERARMESEGNNSVSAAAKSSPASCPPGFSVSENKCSQSERKRGCKDMRLSNGLGCVHRGK